MGISNPSGSALAWRCFLIEKLAVNSPTRTRSKSSVNDESNVIIVDGKNEQIFLMQETLSR